MGYQRILRSLVRSWLGGLFASCSLADPGSMTGKSPPTGPAQFDASMERPSARGSPVSNHVLSGGSVRGMRLQSHPAPMRLRHVCCMSLWQRSPGNMCCLLNAPVLIQMRIPPVRIVQMQVFGIAAPLPLKPHPSDTYKDQSTAAPLRT
ncbi:hypothetical protein BD414DRAFT_472176 [Trametes punicea]|nr:hypothetical protein BD414DRAFT_472176 [Trametes punicea]